PPFHLHIPTRRLFRSVLRNLQLEAALAVSDPDLARVLHKLLLSLEQSDGVPLTVAGGRRDGAKRDRLSRGPVVAREIDEENERGHVAGFRILVLRRTLRLRRLRPGRLLHVSRQVHLRVLTRNAVCL